MLVGAISLVAIATIACTVFVYGVQRSMLFPGLMRRPDPRAGEGIPGLERHWLETGGGRVEAWYLPPRDPTDPGPAPAILFSHGNGELIDDWPRILAGFPDQGIGLLLVEFPGYGRSEGSPSQASVTEALLAGYDLLASRPDVDSARIAAYGRSLGGGAVSALLAQRPVAALILQSTFTSVADMAKHIFAVPAFLIRDPFRNLEAVKDYDGPVLVIHGRQDDMIPYEQGVALAKAAQRGTLVTYECRHNDCPPDWRRFWRDIADFLRAAGLLGGPG
ncbi:MAG: alpha/beta hydrolase [Deltaproteobacteria bacterium]|nr:alpha/beta hydrolase [Deltaproteobacteria bacterium]MBW2417551.1 alpha/beta hydrolase [Deltaproteobacteria bacterium]